MSIPRTHCAVTYALAILLATSAFLAHIRSQQDDEVVRVNTDLVVLNITVTDKAGQYVSSFSVHESPFASVVLLDTSGSMESRLSLARSAAIRFLDRLREEDVAAVYKFDTKVEQVQEFSTSHDLAPMVYGMTAKGMTTLNDAIVDAAKALAPRQEKRKAIIILSDGVDTYSKASAAKAVESALAIGA